MSLGIRAGVDDYQRPGGIGPFVAGFGSYVTDGVGRIAVVGERLHQSGYVLLAGVGVFIGP